MMINKFKSVILLALVALLVLPIVGCEAYDPLPGDLYVDGLVNASRYEVDSADTYIDSDTGDMTVTTAVGKTLVLIPAVWDDLSVSMTNIPLPAALAPVDMPYKSSHVPAFGPDAVNVIYFSVQLPHTYLESSDIEFHIHIIYPDAGAGDSVWYFTYSWANSGDTFPGATPTTVVTPSTGVADEHHKVGILAAIDGTGKKISSVLLCSIQRSGTLGTDTYANYVYLLSGDFHYQVDTMGSRQELIK